MHCVVFSASIVWCRSAANEEEKTKVWVDTAIAGDENVSDEDDDDVDDDASLRVTGHLQRFEREPSASRSTMSHNDVGFVWQPDMIDENDFEVDVALGSRPSNVAAPAKNVVQSQRQNVTERKAAIVEPPTKMQKSFDTESMCSAASFCRSRAASVRLAAERLAAVQRKASRQSTAAENTITTTTRLIKVKNVICSTNVLHC